MEAHFPVAYQMKSQGKLIDILVFLCGPFHNSKSLLGPSLPILLTNYLEFVGCHHHFRLNTKYKMIRVTDNEAQPGNFC